MTIGSKTYNQAKILINNGKYTSKDDMLGKLDVFLMGDRITLDEYKELVDLLEAREASLNE